MVSNNPNLKYNVPMQALGQSAPGMPSMQAIDAQAVKSSVDNSYLANRARASADEDNSAAVLAATIPVWYGISQGMDKFNAKCGGEYSKTPFGKIGAFGDKIADKFNSTAIGKGYRIARVKTGRFLNKLASKSNIVYSLMHHKTAPEWNFAKMPAAGLTGYHSADVMNVLEQFVDPISGTKILEVPIIDGVIPPHYNSFQKLEQYGLSQKEIDDFVKSLKGKSFADKAIALQRKELERLGVPDAQINKLTKSGLSALQDLAKELKIKRLGFKNIAEFEACKADSIGNMEVINKALKRALKKGDLNIEIWKHNGKAGKVSSHLFGREVKLSELVNKTKVTLGQGAKSRLGKFLTKATGYFMEGTTNRFAGGKFAVLMQAFIFGDMLVNTFKAPKGEKGKTFAERFVNDFTYFMAMPLGIWAMHKVGGLKYAGMTKDQVKAYREALKTFNEKAAKAGFANKEAYKKAHEDLQKMLKANVKNPIIKLLKKVGRFINIGNETRLAYQSTERFNLNLLRKGKNVLKNVAGVPLRIAIPMWMIVPFLAKATTKCAHAIFGRPTKSVLDEEPTEEETLAETAAQPASQPAGNPFASASVINNSPTNLVNMYQNGEKYQGPVRTYVPSPEGVKIVDPNAPVLEPKRTYIPSSEGAKVYGPDTSAADAAMARSQRAERLAMETLAMK